MTTVELEPGTIETVDDELSDDEEHRFCHLYQSGGLLALIAPRAVCGIPLAQDWHNNTLHHSVPWEKGMMSCPKCGAPICMDCLLKVS